VSKCQSKHVWQHTQPENLQVFSERPLPDVLILLVLDASSIIDILHRKTIFFFMLKLTKFPPPFGGGSTVYYTSHVMKRFIPHVRREQPLNQFENKFETGRQQKGARRRSASVRRHRAPLALPLDTRDCPGFSTTWPTSFFLRKPIFTSKKIQAGKPICKVSLGSARPVFIFCWLSRLEREGCSNTGPGVGLPDWFHLVGKKRKGLCGASV